MAGDQFLQLIVAADASDSHQVVGTGDRVDFGDAREIDQRLGYVLHLPLSNIDKNYRRDHDFPY